MSNNLRLTLATALLVCACTAPAQQRQVATGPVATDKFRTVYTCHYLIVPDEIIYNHLGSKDKTLAFDEGATHGFTPCKPEYGDTVKRAFDYVDNWLEKPSRF